MGQPYDDEGGAYCWGMGVGRFGPQPPGLQLRTIASGFSHACALTVDGAVACWGDGMLRQTSPPDGIALASGGPADAP